MSFWKYPFYIGICQKWTFFERHCSIIGAGTLFLLYPVMIPTRIKQLHCTTIQHPSKELYNSLSFLLKLWVETSYWMVILCKTPSSAYATLCQFILELHIVYVFTLFFITCETNLFLCCIFLIFKITVKKSSANRGKAEFCVHLSCGTAFT